MHIKFKVYYLILILFTLPPVACEKEEEPKNAVPPPVSTLVKEYENMEEAIAAAGFHCPVPAELPRGYSLKSISTIEGGAVQVIYHTQGNLKINYRMLKGNADISDIHGSFTEKTLNIDDADVIARLAGKRILFATWQRDGLSFSAAFDEPVTETVFIRFVRSIPKLAEEISDLPVVEPVAPIAQD